MDLEKKMTLTMDGNTAAAHMAYGFSEVAGIYPITPSSPMSEVCDKWAANGRKNMFGQVVKVVEMQSEAGASGTVHGSLAAGALTSTFTASQGLLLMIPNMYKMAGELLPAVFHVSSRSLATHALSIFGDQQDVMATRATGFSMLSSSNVQEVMDLAAVAHLTAISASMPMLHFFDGFRTSHEIQKIETIGYESLRPLIDYEALEEFRKRALNPDHPKTCGSAQNPDIYFQNAELKNIYYEKVPDIVNSYMEKIGEITGRNYKPFDYYGHPEADRIIIAMGSVCDTIHETIDYLNTEEEEKTGMISVHLYRPFSAKYLLNVLPDTVKKIAVLDRTKENGSVGEPLYMDVSHVLKAAGKDIEIVGGRYGLSSKNTTPNNIVSVFENLSLEVSKNNFTIGIIDDVSFTSLPVLSHINTTPLGTVNAKFWGLGSDGTVGANKRAIKIIGDNTDMYAQAYFYYDSKKSGNITVSHLRFGKEKIRAPYFIENADYIACHKASFVSQFPIVEGLKEDGAFVLNCPWDDEELNTRLPAEMKKYIAKKNIKFYTVDANKITNKIGLGDRINMVMQSAFFSLSQIIPIEEAVKYLKDGIKKAYGHKGDNIVKMNYEAVDKGLEGLHQVEYPESWKTAEDTVSEEIEVPDFIKNVAFKVNSMQGNRLPVSAFKERPDGSFPSGTTQYEKRGIASFIPRWDVDACIQCNQCSLVCPHAAIRPFLLNEEELRAAPVSFTTKDPIGKQFEGLKYRIQVSPLDCTGCGNCADVCPAPNKALFMEPLADHVEEQGINWNYSESVSYKDDLMSKSIFKATQFAKPLLEFSGACPGCGETAYVKLITQLFGDRMIIANATGCSSIWGANAASMAYTTNEKGHGPAWSNSLFEDNAEFGFGMRVATVQRKAKLTETVERLTESDEVTVAEAAKEYLEFKDDKERSRDVSSKLVEVLTSLPELSSDMDYVMKNQDLLVKISQWIIGGDGWAYDIGYGGLDHVLASGENVNVLVMDTEVYSNTGGQSSKATPTAAIAKFAASGKKIRKKDLGAMAMTYGYVYVAQIALGADMNQTNKALIEAENYDGPSLVIAYAPCIEHGIKTGMGTSVKREKLAVQSGYWHLYRFNPELVDTEKNPFTLDSKEPTLSFRDYLNTEVRYASLMKAFPDTAEELYEKAEKDAKARLNYYKRLAGK